MAERKAGPVKPPVIDLQARPTPPAPPAADASGETATIGPKAIDAPGITAPPETPLASPPEAAVAKDEVLIARAPPDKPAPTGASPTAAASKPGEAKPPTDQPHRQFWPAALAGAAGGAVIGIAICYGLAAAGYWPVGDQAGLGQRLDRVEAADRATQAKLADLGKRLDTVPNDLAPRLATAETGLSAVQADLKSLKSTPADLADLRNQLKSLSSRLDAVAAGASSADAAALAAGMKTAQQNLAALTQQVDALATRAGNTDTTVAALKSELEGARAAIAKAAAAPSPQALAAAMQLPLLISALDADFAAGRPYAADLKALNVALPKAEVPASLTAAAGAGLPAAAAVAADFEAKMPEMIAAEPGSSNGSWQDQLAGWARGVLALRKQGVEPGSGPDALLSQLDAAVARHDFAGAAALLGRLPAPMQQAAGATAGEIRALADAETFIAGLRRQALAPVTGAAS